MRFRKHLFLLFLLTTIFFGGCAFMDKLRAPSLNGSPATSSVVVVECEAIMSGAFGITTSQQIKGGILLRTDGSQLINGQAVGNFIIFSNVPPGEYGLARIQTTWQAGTLVNHYTYNVPPDKVLNYIFSAKVGEPKYMGIVTVEDVRTLSERGINFGIRENKDTEFAAWEKFNQIYEGSPWVFEVQKRLSELKR